MKKNAVQDSRDLQHFPCNQATTTLWTEFFTMFVYVKKISCHFRGWWWWWWILRTEKWNGKATCDRINSGFISKSSQNINYQISNIVALQICNEDLKQGKSISYNMVAKYSNSFFQSMFQGTNTTAPADIVINFHFFSLKKRIRIKFQTEE